MSLKRTEVDDFVSHHVDNPDVAIVPQQQVKFVRDEIDDREWKYRWYICDYEDLFATLVVYITRGAALMSDYDLNTLDAIIEVNLWQTARSGLDDDAGTSYTVGCLLAWR